MGEQIESDLVYLFSEMDLGHPTTEEKRRGGQVGIVQRRELLASESRGSEEWK